MSTRPKSARERTVTGRTNTSRGHGIQRQQSQWSRVAGNTSGRRPATAGSARKGAVGDNEKKEHRKKSNGNQSESPGRMEYRPASQRTERSRTTRGVSSYRSDCSSSALGGYPDAWEVCFTPHDHSLSARRSSVEFGFDKHDFEDGLRVPIGNRPPRPRPVRPRTAPIGHNARTAAPKEDDRGGKESFEATLRKWNEHHLFNVELDPDTRVQVAKNFIQKNQNHIQHLDPEFRGKSYRQIYHFLLGQDAFAAKIMELDNRARTYKSGKSSEAVKRCFIENGNDSVPVEYRRTLTEEQKLRAGMGYGRYTGINAVASDPFIRSLSTSREKKAEQLERLYRPLYNQPNQFKRTGGHDREYGSFSRFNGLLQANKGAMLNR